MTAFPVIAAAFLIAAAGHASAAVLYAPSQIGSSARFSDYGDSSQTGFRSFDNFTVAPGGSVQKVTWTGFYLDLNSPIPAAAPVADALSWDLAFHADNAGVPGAQLFFESILDADVSSTFLGTGTFIVGSTYNVSFYQYSVDLNTPFPLAPLTQYWISVMARSNVYYPAFALRGATGGDDSSFQQQLGAALSVVNGNSVARDRAFVLEGTVVPEPSTVLLGAAGLLLLPLLRRLR